MHTNMPASTPVFTHPVRVLLRVGDRDVGVLDVEVLVARVEGAADGEVVLQPGHVLPSEDKSQNLQVFFSQV